MTAQPEEMESRVAPAPPPRAEPVTGPRHHWVVRLTHWVNVVALTLMVASGLRIFNAYPAFAPRGGTFCCYPFVGHAIPAWLTFGGWLAGARHWHFAMMWVLVANGLLYLGFVFLHGEWRELAPRRGDPRDVWEMVRFYLFVRKDHPRQGKHNALQKYAYMALPILAVAAVITGIAIWKPVQLGWLTRLLGGYVWARYWHFLAMLGLVALTLGHIFMVFSVDPYSIPAMITGRYRADRSPERRNGRPFYHLLPGSERTAAERQAETSAGESRPTGHREPMLPEPARAERTTREPAPAAHEPSADVHEPSAGVHEPPDRGEATQ